MDGRTDGRTQMTHFWTWPRSYPDKHSDQVGKFSVKNYSSYRSTKKVWMDRRMDRQTPDEPYSNLTKILPRQTFWPSLKVLHRKVFQLSQHKERMDGQTDGQMDGQTIWLLQGTRILQHRKVFQLSQHKDKMDGQTDGQMDGQTIWLL